MGHEVSLFRGPSGLERAKEIIERMHTHDIPPTPPNYEIWTGYVAGSPPELCREIETRLTAGEAFTDETNEELFERFFANTRLSIQMLEASGLIARELDGAVSNLRGAGTQAGSYADLLKSTAARFDGGVDSNEFRTMVRQLAVSTHEMAEQNLKLVEQIEASSRQVEELQAALQAVKVEALTDGLTGLANRRMFDDTLAARGVREITLLGQIVTSYGRRDYTHTDGISPFVQLLEKVSAIDGIERIRFTSPHPRGFKDDLVAAYGRLPKLCGYVHLPMQSGSDRILRAMNRPYTRERYREIVDALRAVRSDMYFSTDVIVGFPGETEEEFQQTRELFEACNYDMAYIFKYSIRTGTPAADLGDQIPDEVKEARNQALLEILKANSLRRSALLVGTVEAVLVEGPDKTGTRFTGRTRGNRVCIFDAHPRLIGTLVPLKIERASVSTLYGSLVLGGVES